MAYKQKRKSKPKVTVTVTPEVPRPTPQPAPEEVPDITIATFVALQSTQAHVYATGPRDRRYKMVRFTFPNGDTHTATLGAVLVIRELCNKVIEAVGTDVYVPPQPGEKQ